MALAVHDLTDPRLQLVVVLHDPKRTAMSDHESETGCCVSVVTEALTRVLTLMRSRASTFREKRGSEVTMFPPPHAMSSWTQLSMDDVTLISRGLAYKQKEQKKKVEEEEKRRRRRKRRR